jgi:hypothetical protein
MNSKRFKARFIDFKSLRFPCGTFSDLDGYMVFPGAYVLLECKCGDGINTAQLGRLARMAQDISASGRKAVVLVVHYYDKDPDNDVDIGHEGRVVEVYANGNWYRMTQKPILRDFMDAHYKKLTGDDYHADRYQQGGFGR